MVPINTTFDFTRIRKYHPEIEFIAASRQVKNESITTIPHAAFVDVQPENFAAFLNNYENLLKGYHLQDENVFEILFLTQKTYSDIEVATEMNNDYLEMDVNLSFLLEVLKMAEADKIHKEVKAKKSGINPTNTYPDLTLTIQSINQKGSATLKNPILVDYLIKQIIKIFKDKSYNPELANALDNVEMNSTTLLKIKNELRYRTSDIPRYCTAQTALRVNQYLNEQTTFSSPTGGLLNKQARFIFDLLKEFNLLMHII